MKKIAIIATAALFPMISFAALEELQDLAVSVGDIVQTLIPIVFAVALLVFFWGLVGYIFGSEDTKEAKKKTMIWGVVALFVMASVWGLVAFLGENLGIDQNSAPDVDSLIPQ